MTKLYVVGLGAGNYEGMTVAAIRALERAEVIVGYTAYCELVRPYFPDKPFLATPMRKEVERCRLALETAAGGKTTALICSGDAGIYGMASPVLELASAFDVQVEIVPGVSAASFGGALLGSPLGLDFAVISLSDLLIPLETILMRVEHTAAADLCLVLYNPASRQRTGHLRAACEVLLRHRAPETVCGIVENAGREGERRELLSLKALSDYQANMFTTVFVGNSTTRVMDGWMVTPRGYHFAEVPSSGCLDTDYLHTRRSPSHEV